jgi:hypothetical protein
MATPGSNKSTSVTEYAYVMASTLNQMVNYIPLKMEFSDIKFINIYNVTLKKKLKDEKTEKVKDNNDWDENFKKVVTDLPITNIEIDQKTEWLNVANTIEQINNTIKNETKPIFWNITGGQRPYLMAVWEFTKNRQNGQNDIIAYLEGNTGKIVLLRQDKKEGLVCKDSKTDYAIEGLTIDIALELMGFRQKESEVRENLLDNYNQSKKSFYNTFYKDYCKSLELRKILPDFNENLKGNDKAETLKLITANFKKVIQDISPYTTATVTELEAQWKDFTTLKAFGYILEEMTVNLIFEAIENNPQIKENTASLYASTKINAEYFKKDKRHIDEFDILLLTKTGQLINFECKSGSMSGDNAKSTNYSTYAISGVYGLPILITPQIDKIDKINKNITTAVNAAERANLDIWYLEEIEEKLKERLTK